MAKDHIRDYTTVAASNTDVDGVDVGEGTAPSNINDAIREMMADVSELFQDMGGGLVSAGSQGAFTLTTKDGLAAYAQGQLYAFEANHAMPDTATATLNINAIGAKALRKNVTSNLVANDIVANQLVIVGYEGTRDEFQVLSPVSVLGGASLLDEDDMASDSATDVASQQSIKAYVDGHGVVQIVNTQSGAVATGTTVLPNDDTIPQQTEGVELMTLAVTPTNAANILKIDVVVHCSHTGTSESLAAALFQDATANALACSWAFSAITTEQALITFTHWMVAGTTSATTFKVRAGAASAGTLTFNGWSGGRRYGGVLASSITITEYQA